MGAQRRAGGLRHRHRCQIGAPAVVGIQHLPIGGVGAAASVDVHRRAGPGIAVGAVHRAVVVQIAGQRHAQAGRAAAAHGQQLQAGVGDAQQGDGARAAADTAQDRGALGLKLQAGAGGLYRHDHRTRRPGGLDGAGQLAVAHHKAEVGRVAAVQRAAPGIAGRRVAGRHIAGQPVHRRAQVGGDGIGDQAAVGVVAQRCGGAAVASAAVVAEQAARQHQPALGVVAVGDGLGFGAGGG